MGKVTQVKNGKYIGADKYTITDTSDGKKQVVFSPDQVLEEGTPIGAEILNEIQKNGLYYLNGTHRVSGQESIYDCTLEGIDSFEFNQLCVLFKPDTAPTQSTIKLNISGEIYSLNDKIRDEKIGLILVKSELTAYPWSNYVDVINNLNNVSNKNSVLNAEIVKKLAESNQGLKFDTILNIDDVGTKQEGYCYMFEGDIYKCIKQTEVTTPESANFQPISNNKLSDRLDNLFTVKNIGGWKILEFNKYVVATKYTTLTANDSVINFPFTMKDTSYYFNITNAYTTALNFSQEYYSQREKNSITFKTNWAGGCLSNILIIGEIE